MLNVPAADSTTPTPFALNSQPYGKSYGEWTAIWWRWLVPITENNPLNDDGQNCGQNQTGPVWFLVGTPGGDPGYIRDCTIPKGKAILIPIVSSACDSLTFPKWASDLATCAKSDNNEVKTLVASVDGKELINVYQNQTALEKYRVTSKTTPITNPQGEKIWGLTPGNAKFVIDGFWLFLPPLDPGNHKLFIKGQSGTQFVTEVTYHLTIQ